MTGGRKIRIAPIDNGWLVDITEGERLIARAAHLNRATVLKAVEAVLDHNEKNRGASE